MNDETLTHEARAAIRKYLLSLFAIPGIASLLLAFFLGYLIKDVAEAKAFNEAFGAASETLMVLFGEVKVSAERAAISEGRARRAASTAEDLQGTMEERIEYVDEIVGRARLVEAMQNAEEIGTVAAENLSTRPDFKKAVIDETNERLTSLESDLTSQKNVFNEFISEFGKYEIIHRSWSAGDDPKRLLRYEEGICVLTRIAGRFDSPAQRVELYPAADGFWQIQGNSNYLGLSASVACFRLVAPNLGS